MHVICQVSKKNVFPTKNKINVNSEWTILLLILQKFSLFNLLSLKVRNISSLHQGWKMILLRGCSSSWIQNIKIFLMSMGLILIRNKIVIVKFNCSKQIFLGMLNLHNIHSWWKVDVKNNLDNTKLLVCKWLITRILHYYIKIMKGKCWCNIQWFITVLWYNLLIHSLRKMLTWALNLRKTNWKSEALTDRDRHNFFFSL